MFCCYSGYTVRQNTWFTKVKLAVASVQQLLLKCPQYDNKFYLVQTILSIQTLHLRCHVVYSHDLPEKGMARDIRNDSSRYKRKTKELH